MKTTNIIHVAIVKLGR